MATRPPDISDRIRADHCAVRAAMGTGVSAGYAASTRSYWTQWLQFCAQLNLDPHLANIADPIPFLQIFAHRVRTGELAIHGQRVRKRQVEQYLRAVGQVLSGLGARDPRHDAHGNTDFRISRQLRSYAREDPPPTRVKPLPIAVLHDIFRHHIRGNARDQCIADVIWSGFYFLLRPGEHCDAGASTASARRSSRSTTAALPLSLWLSPRPLSRMLAPPTLVLVPPMLCLLLDAGLSPQVHDGLRTLALGVECLRAAGVEATPIVPISTNWAAPRQPVDSSSSARSSQSRLIGVKSTSRPPSAACP